MHDRVSKNENRETTTTKTPASQTNKQAKRRVDRMQPPSKKVGESHSISVLP
jgi:hypothetical protein